MALKGGRDVEPFLIDHGESVVVLNDEINIAVDVAAREKVPQRVQEPLHPVKESPRSVVNVLPKVIFTAL